MICLGPQPVDSNSYIWVVFPLLFAEPHASHRWKSPHLPEGRNAGALVAVFHRREVSFSRFYSKDNFRKKTTNLFLPGVEISHCFRALWRSSLAGAVRHGWSRVWEEHRKSSQQGAGVAFNQNELLILSFKFSEILKQLANNIEKT